MKVFWERLFNTSFLLLGTRVITKLITVFVMAVLARVLGVAQFGLLSSVMALTLFAGLVADYGLIMPTIRSISSNIGQTHSILQHTITIRIVGSFLGFACVVVVGYWLGLPIVLVSVFGISSIQESISTAIIRSFEGRQEMKIVTIYAVIERFVYALLIISLTMYFNNIEGVAFAHLLAFSINLVIANIIFSTRLGSLKIELELNKLSYYLQLGTPFFITSIVTAVFYKADTLLLNHFRSPSEVGIYNAALRIIESQMFIPMTMMVSVFPILSKMYHEKDLNIISVFYKMFQLFIIVGLSIAAIIYFTAPMLIQILFTKEYRASVLALQIISLMLPFYFCNYLLSQSLIAIKKETAFSLTMVITSLISLGLNYFIIPYYGYIGSAWVRVCGEVLASSIFLWILIEQKNRMGRYKLLSAK